MRHCLAQEAPHTSFCFEQNLLFGERYTPPFTQALRGFNEIDVPGVLVAYLEFVFVLIGFHEKALLDIEEHG